MKTSTLVKLRILFYSIWALASSWVTAMADVTWAGMGWEAHSCLIGGLIVSWTGVMMAFFDKSVWKLDEERKAQTELEFLQASKVMAGPDRPLKP